MHFHLEQEIGWPPEIVMEALRDRPQRLVAYMNHIDRVETLERLEQADLVQTVRTWWLDADHLPAPLRAVASTKVLGFEERLAWKGSEATFAMAPLRHAEAVQITGVLHFEDEDPDTLLVVRGEVSLDLSKLPRLPETLRDRGSGFVTELLVSAARPNIQRLCSALERMLEDEF